MAVVGEGRTGDALIEDSNASGSRLERIVIGGGGGPANIVGVFRNCCCNQSI